MKVSLVGAGPGDIGLFTLRGRELLEEADVVIYDALVNSSLLNFAPDGAELIYVGKVASNHALPQAEINQLLVKKAREGKNVVRLKGGDPYIFGRGGEEGEVLCAENVPFEVVPGISSAIAAPAYAGIPLTHRDMVSSISIITGHENPDKTCSALNWHAFAQSGSTLVFVMGVKNLPSIAKNLVSEGMNPDTPAAIIYRGTSSQQRSLYSTLSKLPEEAKKADYTNPSVIVVGKVVNLHSCLDWFTKKPLLGKRIVVTRAREQASEMVKALHALGADVLECPSIAIVPIASHDKLDEALGRLDDYGWIIFTSANGVEYFWSELLKHGKDARSLGRSKIACIGSATAKALAQKGIQADLVPESYVAESVAAALIARECENLRGMRILLPRAAAAREILPEELARHGAIVDVIPLYEALADQSGAEHICKMLENGLLNCVTFASSSTVRNFLECVPADLVRAHPEMVLAAIGPVTAKTLEEFGLSVSIQPEKYTIPALVEALVHYFSDHD